MLKVGHLEKLIEIFLWAINLENEWIEQANLSDPQELSRV